MGYLQITVRGHSSQDGKIINEDDNSDGCTGEHIIVN
jgi:hypothetical protein